MHVLGGGRTPEYGQLLFGVAPVLMTGEALNKTENEGIAPVFPENGETVKEEKFMEPLDMEHYQQENLKKD